MYNPRWPHTFVIKGESLDENGLPVTDDQGRPVESEVTLKKCIYDSNWNPRFNSDGTYAYEEVTAMPWGYRTSTGGLKTAGEVIVADYKISTPKCLTEIPTGTILELTDDTHTFLGKVMKFTTYNWGTDIWIDNVKN